MQDYAIRPIGVVRSTYTEPSLTLEHEDLELDEEILTATRTGRDSISELVVHPEYEDCLDGIEDFSHVVVLYWAHRVSGQQRETTKKVHPAGQTNCPLVGIFATRSPVRPNPICSTTVELLEKNGKVLKVKGLDGLDGSPIVDIKCHLPSYDAPSDVKWPEWRDRLITFFRERLK